MKHRHIRASSNEWVHVQRSNGPRSSGGGGGDNLLLTIGLYAAGALLALWLIPWWLWLLLIICLVVSKSK